MVLPKRKKRIISDEEWYQLFVPEQKKVEVFTFCWELTHDDGASIVMDKLSIESNNDLIQLNFFINNTKEEYLSIALDKYLSNSLKIAFDIEVNNQKSSLWTNEKKEVCLFDSDFYSEARSRVSVYAGKVSDDGVMVRIESLDAPNINIWLSPEIKEFVELSEDKYVSSVLIECKPFEAMVLQSKVDELEAELHSMYRDIAAQAHLIREAVSSLLFICSLEEAEKQKIIYAFLKKAFKDAEGYNKTVCYLRQKLLDTRHHLDLLVPARIAAKEELENGLLHFMKCVSSEEYLEVEKKIISASSASLPVKEIEDKVMPLFPLESIK